jgi:hypothetical protein
LFRGVVQNFVSRALAVKPSSTGHSRIVWLGGRAIFIQLMLYFENKTLPLACYDALLKAYAGVIYM